MYTIYSRNQGIFASSGPFAKLTGQKVNMPGGHNVLTQRINDQAFFYGNDVSTLRLLATEMLFRRILQSDSASNASGVIVSGGIGKGTVGDT